MGTVWGLLEIIVQLWRWLKAAIGLAEKVSHEKKQDEISEEAKDAGDLDATEEERREAVGDLEDIVNRRS